MSKFQNNEIMPPPADLRMRQICRKQSSSTQPNWSATEVRLQSASISQSAESWKTNGKPSTMLSVSSNYSRHPTPFLDDEGIKMARDIYTPEVKIPMQEFPENAEVIFIIITNAISPGNFYWYFHNKHNDIKKLSKEMNNFYSPNYGQLVLKKEMYLGMLVAVKYLDYLWYRARLVRSCSRDDFEVFLIDIGQFVKINIDDLYRLSNRFTKLPMQSFCGKMFGIHSFPNANNWSDASCNKFWELVKDDKIIAAKVVSEVEEPTAREPNRVFLLHLVKLTNGRKDLPIDDFLVDNGMAEYDSDKIPPDFVRNADIKSSSVHDNLEPSICSSKPANKSNQHCQETSVKQLSLSDDRKIHVVRDGDELFIPEYDLKLILPSLDRQMTTNKIKISSVKIINDQSHPFVFIDALRLKAAWMRDEDNGSATEEIKLYPLNIVSSLIFLFKKNMEKEALFVIEKELKNFKKYETVANGETNRMSLRMIRKIN